LFDTLAIENVSTLRLNRILGNVVAQAAQRCFSFVCHKELALIVFAAQDQVRMTGHLPHPGEQAEDVRVICEEAGSSTSFEEVS
jgi:hypothetical protein